jgi:hypothetical protein
MSIHANMERARSTNANNPAPWLSPRSCFPDFMNPPEID